MGRSNGFAGGDNHLVERATLRELRVEFPAEFTWPAGACVEAIDNSWISMFHERRLLGEARTDSPGCGAETNILPQLIIDC
jgi:hypothetical protein